MNESFKVKIKHAREDKIGGDTMTESQIMDAKRKDDISQFQQITPDPAQTILSQLAS